jgi:hypothetical protein
MTLDILDFIFKCLTLVFITGVIQFSIGRKFWTMAVFGQAVWLLIFRGAFLRAITLYMGVFRKGSLIFIDSFQKFLMSSTFGIVVDFIVLLGAIAVFAMLAENKTYVDKALEKK